MSADDYISRPHDLFTRQSLERREIARDIIGHYLPPGLVRQLKLETLTLVAGSFVDSELRASQSDVLYDVQFSDDRHGQIYILFEHKSHADSATAFQLLKYIVRIWERQQRQKESLTPIVPVVLYHGAASWTTARSIPEMVDAPDSLTPYIPDFTFELLDLTTYRDDQLSGESLTRATLLLLKYIFDEDLRSRLAEILRSAAEQRGGHELTEILRSFLTYVAAAARRIEPPELRLVARQSLGAEGEDVVSSILEQWVAKGREEGREEGRVNSLRGSIRDILEVRFPDDVAGFEPRINQIESADALQQLLRLCVAAASAAEVRQWLDSRS
ncbi:MAG: Rpn family recombination-promoting nuclease/putative transposase [Planctomycetaceae bacterium]